MRLLAKEETPLDWTSKKIGSYVLGHKGGAALRPSDFSDVGFPVIPKKAIQPTGELLIESPTYCTNEFASNNKRSIVDNSYTITTLRDLVPTGPTIGTVVNFTSEEKYILSQGVYGLKLNDDLDKKYLSYLSNTSFYRKVMQRIMVGSTQVHIRTPEYLDLEIQIPPLLEQQKIAKILSTWDRAISTTECLIDNSTQQKKALMQQLLTGKKRLLDESGNRFEGEWEEVSLGDISKYQKGYTYKSSEYSEDKTSYGFLTLKSILRGGGYSASGIKYLLASVDEKFAVKSGDVVFAVTDLTRNAEVVGAPIFVPELEFEKAYISMDLIKLEIKPSVDKLFIYYLLQLASNRNFMRARASGSTVLHLDVKGSKKLKLRMPKLVIEQQKIAIVLTNADKEIELLEQQLADLQQEKKALMQVLLTGKKRVKT